MKKTLLTNIMSGQVLYGKSNVKNIGEYHDLYLKIDVYLVTDVFFGGGICV